MDSVLFKIPQTSYQIISQLWNDSTREKIQKLSLTLFSATLATTFFALGASNVISLSLSLIALPCFAVATYLFLDLFASKAPPSQIKLVTIHQETFPQTLQQAMGDEGHTNHFFDQAEKNYQTFLYQAQNNHFDTQRAIGSHQIHHTPPDPKSSAQPLPPFFQSWTQRTWTPQTLGRLYPQLIQHFPNLHKTYFDRLSSSNQQFLIRASVIYTSGGTVIPHKMQCVAPMETLHSFCPLYFVFEKGHPQGTAVSPHLFGARKQHPFFDQFFSQVTRQSLSPIQYFQTLASDWILTKNALVLPPEMFFSSKQHPSSFAKTVII